MFGGQRLPAEMGGTVEVEAERAVLVVKEKFEQVLALDMVPARLGIGVGALVAEQPIEERAGFDRLWQWPIDFGPGPSNWRIIFVEQTEQPPT